MAQRVNEIQRVLKSTGSFYLHCDPTASHYLKLVLDSVFCARGGDFRNEVIWDYTFRLMDLPKFFNRKHDVIFFYSKSKDSIFHMPKTEWTKETLMASRKQKIHVDEDGVEWIWMPGGKGNSKNKMRKVDELIEGGKAISDVWQIPIISSSSKERLGYPTQKPETLLERIIQASSNEGDTVLDAFCGCGTSVAVAQRLRRNWVGIDITYQSIAVILQRLEDSFGETIADSVVLSGIPRDMQSAIALANKKDDRLRKEFEKWSVLTYSKNRAAINEKKGADRGVDGIAYMVTGPSTTDKVIFQVKSGGVKRNDIATLRGDVAREDAAIGVLITLEPPTKPMRDEAAAAGVYHHELLNRDYPRLLIVTVQDIIENGVRIDLPLTADVLKSATSANTEEQSPLF